MGNYCRGRVEIFAVYDDYYFVSIDAAVLNAVDFGQKVRLKLLLKFFEVLGIVFCRVRTGIIVAERSLCRGAEYKKHNEKPEKQYASDRLYCFYEALACGHDATSVLIMKLVERNVVLAVYRLSCEP